MVASDVKEDEIQESVLMLLNIGENLKESDYKSLIGMLLWCACRFSGFPSGLVLRKPRKAAPRSPAASSPTVTAPSG